MMNVLLETLFSALPNWMSILIVFGLSLIALLLAVLLVFLLIRAVLRIEWKSQTANRYIRICNEGNVTGSFLLQVDVPQDDLKFQCLLDGNALPSVTIVPNSFSTANKPIIQPAQVSKPIQSSIAAPTTPPQSENKDGTKKKVTESAEKAKEKSKKGLGMARLFVGIFSSLGSLLPGSLGASFKEKSADLQKATQDASAKIEMPEQKLKSVEHLKGQVNQIKPGEKNEKSASGPTPPSNITPGQAGVPKTNTTAGWTESNHTPVLLNKNSTRFLQTPSLSPGELLCLELRIDPIHPYRSGEYHFTVLVRQSQSLESALQDNNPDTTSRGRVTIAGLSPIYRILSFLMVLCAVVLNGTWVVLFISWLTGFVLQP